MKELLEQAWWMLAVRGAIAILFGILALIWPGLTLLWLVVLFAAYALISGASEVAAAVKNRARNENWWLILLLGLVSLGAGVIAVFHPDLTALIFVLLMGANALATGVLDIASAIRLRKVMEGEWLLILAGVVSILFGILVFLFPGAGALALVWLISFYAVVTGVLLLTLAFRARAWMRTGELRHA
ncbi:HdeD family acid-resistance protein [Methylocaldum sp.]|uniref:HdeD family acid-resistance protein n=1 Tax=Methylocaldum sp. TaxID=1969727 RepID=UPI002D4D015E|nr:HdeD family acid-resistance protein [Methylocaldum sp.]HYE35782.1 HdeD family acid-resistance protein [Methylocaldum sp.]